MTIILTLTGPSGVGKTTIAREILRFHRGAQMVPSVTTRGRRESDLPNEYHHVDDQQFEVWRIDNPYAWDVNRDGTKYGTPYSTLRTACESRSPIGIMILVPDTVPKLERFVAKEYAGQTIVVPIFLLPPEEELLRLRMLERGDKPDDIDTRIAKERGWVEDARHSDTSFRFVDPGRELSELPGAVRQILKQLGH